MADKKLPFFDVSKARGPRSGPDVGKSKPVKTSGKSPSQPMSVSLLITRIKGALSDAFPKRISVVGELSNFKLHTSGHMYFRLKDANAAIDAAMFRSSASKLKFRPTDGMEVVVTGRVDVYDARGQLQLYAESMTPKGEGALELAFRQLKEKLEKEGLFDPEKKKPIPAIPRALGLVTSPTGAAVRDIRRTLARRWPGAEVYLVPTLVQGEGAAESVAQGVRLLDANAGKFGIDTIIVSRGGGSMEDLWAFNEEVVARAIFAASVPVISGVGHEVDVTISDLVADVRAATPTAAAELAVPDKNEIARHIEHLSGRLRSRVLHEYRAASAGLDAIGRSVVFRDPMSRLRSFIQRIDELGHRLRASVGESLSLRRKLLEPIAHRLAALHPARLHERAKGQIEKLKSRLRWALGARSKRAGDKLSQIQRRLEARHPRIALNLAKQRVDGMARQLEALSYRSVLKRGFNVTRGPDGQIIRSVKDAKIGELVETQLFDGEFTSQVKQVGKTKRQSPKKAAKKTKKTDDNPTLFD